MRKNWKKICAILMVSLMMIAVAACTASNGDPTTAPQMEIIEGTLDSELATEGIQKDLNDSTEGATEEVTEEPTEEITEAPMETEDEDVGATEPGVEETKPKNNGFSGSKEDNKTEPSVSEPSATEPIATAPPETQPPATEPIVTEPPVTRPSATEPPTTQPSVTEPPETQPAVADPTEPTECVHDWNKIYHPQEGYYGEWYVVCACGYRCNTADEWRNHKNSYPVAEALMYHGGWGSAQDYIVTVQRHYECICKKCGAREIEYVS